MITTAKENILASNAASNTTISSPVLKVEVPSDTSGEFCVLQCIDQHGVKLTVMK